MMAAKGKLSGIGILVAFCLLGAIQLAIRANSMKPHHMMRSSGADARVKDAWVERDGGRTRETNPRRKKKTHRHSHNNATAEDSRPLPCTLRRRPVPMILMSLGRSGSSSTYQVLSKLSSRGEMNERIYEYTGGSTENSRRFFRSIPSSDVNGDWLLKFICYEQRHYPKSGIVGFKWKPFETLFSEEKALQGLALLARLKRIKVVRSRRNLLDVQISRHKHRKSKESEQHIMAHCAKKDEECIQAQIKAGTGLALPTRRLVKELKSLDDMERRTDALLAEMGVPTIHISFEKLFLAGRNVTEWGRAFDFLGVGPSKDELTADAIREAGHAATSVPYHNVTLSNYEEVKEALSGTKFSSLLH